jgi:hypothetical protein
MSYNIVKNEFIDYMIKNKFIIELIGDQFGNYSNIILIQLFRKLCRLLMDSGLKQSYLK